MTTLIAADVKTGATTYVVPSDGSATTLSSLGIRDGKTHETQVAADTVFLTARRFDFSVKDFVVSLSAPNGYTQARVFSLLRFPKILANGKRTVSTLKIEHAYDIEVTDAEKLDQRLIGSQILGGADFADYWNRLSLG